MKERPILFSGPMIRALLAGTKTQTRRVVKGAPEGWAPIGPETFSPTVINRHGNLEPGPATFGAGNADGDRWICCPFGAPGARLWVREAWRTQPLFDDQKPSNLPKAAAIRYEADEALRVYSLAGYGLCVDGKLRPSMFMPRWASRITLEVTEVRVERLQDISEADALAEGVERCISDTSLVARSLVNGSMHADRFAKLWESINGPGSWDANPWVWVVSFRRLP